MPLVNWRNVLQEHGIPSIDRGPNVKRGELNIQCPFCASADPSKHMGLNLESGFWACWRNREHRGKSPVRLLVKLLGIPYWQARKIAGLTEESYADPDGFDAVAARIMKRTGVEKVEHVRREFLKPDIEFEPLARNGSKRFLRYMAEERQFGYEADYLFDMYGIMYAQRGPFKDRIVIPYFVDRELVAWTARAIGPATIRYRDLERDACLIPIKEMLYNYDCGRDGGKALVVQEGPVDALKVDMFGRSYGVRSVALSTNSISDEQIYMLDEIAPQFERVLVMMDMATELGIVASMRMKQDLGAIPNMEIVPVPFGAKDGGALSPGQVERWAQQL